MMCVRVLFQIEHTKDCVALFLSLLGLPGISWIYSYSE